MAGTEKAVMNVLLKSLLDQDLIAKDTYEKSLSLVHSTIDFPPFFEYSVCCGKEGNIDGCTQNQAGAAAGQVVL